MAGTEFDLIVLGAGSGGVRAARLAAAAGRRVAVVEEGRVGGTCVMRGCVPKKLLVIGAHFAEDIADARGFGWDFGSLSFDWARLVAAKNAELARLEGVYTRMLRDAGVTLIEGRGRLLDNRTVAVGERRMTAATILIATGGRPHLPVVPGIEHAITSNEALDLMQLPERVTIVGGGYIAVEFAGIFNALGAKVTQVVRADTVLRGFDQDLRIALAEEMIRKGIELRAETQVHSIERLGRSYSLRLSGEETLDADLVLYATGRVPNTDGLGLEAAGVAVDARGAVVVDDYSRTTADGVWAVGDVTNRINLTPVALAEAVAFVETAIHGRVTAADRDDVPSAVFSLPPVATVGLSEVKARQRYGCIDVYQTRFRPLRNTLAGREERTVMKMVVERASQRVLGVHMVGPDAPEIVQGFAVAVKCGATKAQVDATIGIHPTAAEELVTLRDRRPDPNPECDE